MTQAAVFVLLVFAIPWVVGPWLPQQLHAYGGTRMGDNPETNAVRSLGLFARSAEPWHPWRIGDGHERGAQSCTNGASARVATAHRLAKDWRNIAT
ncbi:MAG TPA: hypothetical protein VFV95_02100 [Vicinamibacterales bacterium]|nr:hypothetical protein [Vicinamibacterales bacterium]